MNRKFGTDMFGNRFFVGSKVVFAHQSKIYEGVVIDIEYPNGPVLIRRESGTGSKLPREPKRDGEQILLIDEISARPNQ